MAAPSHRRSCAVSSAQPLCRVIHRLPAGPAALPSTHASCKRAENSSKTAGTGRLGRNLQPFPLLLGCKRARLKAPRACEPPGCRPAPLDAFRGHDGCWEQGFLMGKHQPHARDVLSPSDGAGWDLPESSFLCLLRHRGNFPVPCVAPWGLTVTPTALPAPGTSPSLLQSPQTLGMGAVGCSGALCPMGPLRHRAMCCGVLHCSQEQKTSRGCETQPCLGGFNQARPGDNPGQDPL